MKKTNKFLSIILAILMVISIIPITASAATYSGACGDNVNWTYDSSTYTLTISGTGNMYDYKSNNRPWGSYEDSIKVVVVEDGVTSIGTRAFYHCEKLITVTLPDSITLIGEYAFRECKKLKNINIPNNVKEINPHTFTFCESITNITIPNNVTIIGENAFYACYGLTEITVPDNVISISESAFKSCRNLKNLIIGSGVETIGKWAFANCDSLTEVTIPANVTTIDDIAFSYCESLEKITVDSNNPYYSNDDYGVLFDKDKTTLIQYPLGSAQTSYTIPDGTITISDYALEYALNLESVIIPESVIVLGKYVFRNNNDGFVLFYKGTQAQWDELLANNSETSEYLKNYTVNCIDNTIYPSGACGDNLIWTFNAHTSTLTISGTGPMYDYEINSMSGFINQPWCDLSRNIKHIVIEDGATSIGEAAFTSCYVTDITIGNSVASIGSYALDHCDDLTTIIVDEDNPYYSNDEFGVLFNKDKTTLLYYPLGSQRESYTIPDSVTTIKQYAFNNCGEVLKSITVPKSVTTIEKSAISQYGAFTRFDINYLGTETEWNSIDGSDDISFWIGVTFAEQEHKHNYESVVTKPTCTEQGYTTYTCECGDSYVANYVDALGHTEEIIPAVAPTCTETGLTEGAKCSVCDVTLTEQQELPQNGHTPADAVEENYVAPTCTENGSKDVVIYCSVCDEEISRDTVVINATGHSYTTVITAPTCIEQGYTTYTCSCGDNYVDDYVNATGHADNDGDGYCDACPELLDPSVECECNCHKSGISKFFFNLILFFQKIFGSNKTCACGVAHY